MTKCVRIQLWVWNAMNVTVGCSLSGGGSLPGWKYGCRFLLQYWIKTRDLSHKSHIVLDKYHYATICNRNVHTWTHFCYKISHCGIWGWCIVGFVQQVYYINYRRAVISREISLLFRRNNWYPEKLRKHIEAETKIDDISQTTSSSAFSWMKMFEFRLKFQWSLFQRVQLTIFQHWFR